MKPSWTTSVSATRLFNESDTQAIHSAIYIADKVVFTKNGPSEHSPWILMDMDTLISHYSTNTDLTIRGYRKKRGEAEGHSGAAHVSMPTPAPAK